MIVLVNAQCVHVFRNESESREDIDVLRQRCQFTFHVYESMLQCQLFSFLIDCFGK